MYKKIVFNFNLFAVLIISLFSTCYSHENNEISLTPESIKQNGIEFSKAGPQKINKQLEVVGKVTTNRDSMAYIYPRFAGVVKSLKKNLGDTVLASEVLAVVESNESLQTYELTSPIAGTIVKKNAIQGELVKEDKPIYEIANLDTVWVDLSIYCKDALCVKTGQPVVISLSNKLRQESTISYVAPIGIEDNQTMLARVVLSNVDKKWVPGMYVDAAISIEQKEVPVAVTRGAVQKINNVPVVFTQVSNHFKPVPVQLGLVDKNFVEILSGLQVGQTYVSANSFLFKAELGKGDADQDD